MENFDEKACECIKWYFMLHGYHVYKNIGYASSDIGEELICKRVPGNQKDMQAVTITKEDVTAGHTPRAISIDCT